MKLMVLQDTFRRGLAIASRAVAGKSTLPVLANVLLATDEWRIRIAATNLAMTVTCWIGARIEEEGAVTIPAKLLSDFISGLPNAPIEMDLDAATPTMRLACAQFKANIKGIEADEFPIIPTMDDDARVVSFPAADLREALEQVVIAAAADDTRPVLAGIHMRVDGDTMRLEAADGFRMAIRFLALPYAADDALDLVIPARMLAELSRLLNGVDGNIEMAVTPNQAQVLFRVDGVELMSRLIDGRFPDVDRVIPTTYNTRAIFDTAALAGAVRMASHFAIDAAHKVVLVFDSEGGDGGGVLISAQATEVGDSENRVAGLVHGETARIILNAKYLIDALGTINTEQVVVETQGAKYPAVLKPANAEGYTHTHIIMPIS